MTVELVISKSNAFDFGIHFGIGFTIAVIMLFAIYTMLYKAVSWALNKFTK